MASTSGVSLPSKAKKVQLEIMKEAGVDKATVTRVSATPGEQATVMYKNIIRRGLKKERAQYRKYGNKVIDVYVENIGEKKAGEIIKLMTDKINKLGPSKVSHHCSKNYIVWDIAPSSVSDKPAYVKAAEAHSKIVRFHKPPKDRAYHHEIKK